MSATPERVRPYANGTQAAAWQVLNCDDCRKADAYDDDGNETRACTCDILFAVAGAYLDDGTVAAEIGRRMGFVPSENLFVWQCPEFEAEGGPA